MKNILSVNNNDAKKYFLLSESYCNFQLPPYYNFEPLLKKINCILKDSKESIFDKNTIKEKNNNCLNINCKIVTNKDCNLAWRQLQLINPILYVDFINYITKEDNWKILQERLLNFQSNKKIICQSIPLCATKNIRKYQINHWYNRIEQESLKQGLEFNYCFITDIQDCYSSIYTHSISWAIHGKSEAKQNRRGRILGNVIDKYLQFMNDGQTNGIPQGSILMDFIAEIVLGYADFLLSEKIENQKELQNYKILRYRDDYRIFVNTVSEGNLILKDLTEVLLGLNLKLNPHKTTYNDDIISSSIKKDKIYWLTHKVQGKNNQKKLLIIYFFSKKFPNSGTIKKLLTEFNKNLKISKSDDIEVLINIVISIAYYNISSFHLCMSIISKMLQKVECREKKQVITEKIIKKLTSIPHSDYSNIWLQRCFIKNKEFNNEFNHKLCTLVNGTTSDLNEIWNYEWFSDKKIQDVMVRENIINIKSLNTITDIIKDDEVNIFPNDYLDDIGE